MQFSEMEFQNLNNLFFFIIPILSILMLLVGYRKKENILKKLRFDSNILFKKLRIIIIIFSLCLIVFSLLGPQTFNGFSETSKKGLDIYVLFDTSKSMLVEDIKPNRLNRSKKIVEDLIENLDGDRIGLIPFSSDAYIQMPLTDDYKLAKMFLDVIDTDMIGGGGTNINRAISLAKKSFNESSKGDNVIIILSDGEEHSNTSNSDSLESSTFNNLKVYTIGIGLKKGGLIPIHNSTNTNLTYKKDKDGNFVMSHLNPDNLKELAVLGNGKYYASTLAGNEISSLLNDISTLDKSISTTKKIKKFNKLFQYFLGSGILLFLVGHFLPERRRLS